MAVGIQFYCQTNHENGHLTAQRADPVALICSSELWQLGLQIKHVQWDAILKSFQGSDSFIYSGLTLISLLDERKV